MTGNTPYAAGLLVGLTILLPWTTMWRLGTDDPTVAVQNTPLWLITVGAVAALALWTAGTDAWLGGWLGYLSLRALPSDGSAAFEVLALAAVGVAVVVASRTIPESWHLWIIAALVTVGLLETGYVVLQAMGYDPLWVGNHFPARLRMLGTLGNENFVGAYLGILLVLGPRWAWPLFAFGIVLTNALTGLIAASVGLLVRARVHWMGWAVLAGAFTGWMAWHGALSLQIRGRVWAAAVADTTPWTALFGHGLGSWADRMPKVQPWVGVGEHFVQAHNDYLQFWYEAGLLGVALLIGWLWTHRAMFTHLRYGGALAALSVTALTMFPFHLAVLGTLGALLLGLATKGDA